MLKNTSLSVPRKDHFGLASFPNHDISSGQTVHTDTNHATTNSAPVRLSINELPYDILVLIFDLVSHRDSCQATPRNYLTSENNTPPAAFLGDPAILSQVCSYWRQTAIHIPSLWSFIVIRPLLGPEGLAKAVARWQLYVKRSGSSLLDIHIIDTAVTKCVWGAFEFHEPPPSDARLFTLIEAIAPRTQRLVFWSRCPCYHNGFPRDMIATFLRSCVPSVLKVLSVHVYPIPGIRNMGPCTLTSEAGGPFDDKLQRLLDSVVILDVDGYYPSIPSKAYYGLVELRLQASRTDDMTVEEFYLIRIIESSPGLRVLEFDLRVNDMEDEDSLDPLFRPIHLDDLQVVILGRNPRKYLGNILRWLFPGPKPLSLSICSPYERGAPDLDFFTQHETQKFIARSNVTRLGLHSVGNSMQLAHLLKMAPNVEVLAIDAVTNVPANADLLPKPQRWLDSLYVIPSSYTSPPSRENVQWFVQTYGVRNLTVWSKDFEFDGVFGEEAMGDHSARYPVINVKAGEPNPVAEWY
ncbi:F-box-like domain protein, putative, partial [Rhizoctonia solani AG-3 Rhs1AP]